jgi:hypothetical protein
MVEQMDAAIRSMQGWKEKKDVLSDLLQASIHFNQGGPQPVLSVQASFQAPDSGTGGRRKKTWNGKSKGKGQRKQQSNQQGRQQPQSAQRNKPQRTKKNHKGRGSKGKWSPNKWTGLGTETAMEETTADVFAADDEL